MTDFVLVGPDQDAWGDGGLALYCDGQLHSETTLGVEVVLASMPLVAGMDLATAGAMARAAGQPFGELTYDSGWLGRIGSFPDQLSDLCLYDPDRSEE